MANICIHKYMPFNYFLFFFCTFSLAADQYNETRHALESHSILSRIWARLGKTIEDKDSPWTLTRLEELPHCRDIVSYTPSGNLVLVHLFVQKICLHNTDSLNST